MLNNKVLIADPDRYGRLGQQTKEILAAYLLAKLTGSRLLTPEYKFLCQKWNALIDWSQSQLTTSKLEEENWQYLSLGTDLIECDGHTKWGISDEKTLQQILNMINSVNGNSLIQLPFGQGMGYLEEYLSRDEIVNDLKRVFQKSTTSAGKNSFHACIHIRRGDCNPERFPDWYINDSFYVKLIRTLLHPQTHVVDGVVICTQGSIDGIMIHLNQREKSLVKVMTTNQLFNNKEDVRDFSIMANADVLFCCRSSFSHIAHLVSPKCQIAFDFTRINTGRIIPEKHQFDPDKFSDKEMQITLEKILEHKHKTSD